MIFDWAVEAELLSDNGNVNLTDGASDHEPEPIGYNIVDNFIISCVATECDI